MTSSLVSLVGQCTYLNPVPTTPYTLIELPESLHDQVSQSYVVHSANHSYPDLYMDTVRDKSNRVVTRGHTSCLSGPLRTVVRVGTRDGSWRTQLQKRPSTPKLLEGFTKTTSDFKLLVT